MSALHIAFLAYIPLQRAPVSSSLVSYTHQLPVKSRDPSGYDQVTLVDDLVAHAKSHVTSNAVVIPVLQTFNILIEANALDRLSDDNEGVRRYTSSLYHQEVRTNSAFL